MIEVETVLILGAGASKPYGYPTGRELRQQILSRAGKVVSDEAVRLVAGLPSEPKDLVSFRDAFQRAGTVSIDEFLQERGEFVDIGRWLVADRLLPMERDPDRLHKTKPDEHWYELLFRHMGPSLSAFRESRLSVVTFNYDTSLEHYLHTALVNRYGLNLDKATEALESLPIVHVHGALDEVPWVRWTDPDWHASLAYKDLRIIHDEIPRELLERCWRLIVEARRVYFLGFGFHQANLGRLSFRNLANSNHGKEIAGTAYGLTRREMETIERMSGGAIKAPSLYDCGIVDFFRSHVTLSDTVVG